MKEEDDEEGVEKEEEGENQPMPSTCSTVTDVSYHLSRRHLNW